MDDLQSFNVMIIPDGSGTRMRRELGDDGVQKLKEWVRSGGVLIGYGGAGDLAATKDVGLSSVASAAPDSGAAADTTMAAEAPPMVSKSAPSCGTNPTWREVFDDSASSKILNPNITEGSGCDGGGWLQTDPTDRYLYHAVIGRNPGALDAADPGVPKMVYVLDIAKLVAAGTSTTCSIDTTFRDENEGTPCVDFNRTDWPHGRNGDAKPHSELFVVPDDSLH